MAPGDACSKERETKGRRSEDLYHWLITHASEPPWGGILQPWSIPPKVATPTISWLQPHERLCVAKPPSHVEDFIKLSQKKTFKVNIIPGVHQIVDLISVCFPGAADGKGILLPMQETREMQVRSLGREDPLEQLQYSCLENSMDRGAWWATVHGAPKSWTRLSTSLIVQACIVHGVARCWTFTFTSPAAIINAKLQKKEIYSFLTKSPWGRTRFL